MASDSRGGKGDQSHVRVYDAMQRSAAWRALSGNAVKALVHIASFEKPSSSPNGSLFMSWRSLAEGIGLNRKTAGRALRELLDKGFLRATAPGHFDAKGGAATTYRLTWRAWPGRMGPSNEWREWRPEEIEHGSKKRTGTGPKNGPASDFEDAAGVKIGPAKARKPQNPVNAIGPNNGPHTIATAGLASHHLDGSEQEPLDPLNPGGRSVAKCNAVRPETAAFAAKLRERADAAFSERNAR